MPPNVQGNRLANSIAKRRCVQVRFTAMLGVNVCIGVIAIFERADEYLAADILLLPDKCQASWDASISKTWK